MSQRRGFPLLSSRPHWAFVQRYCTRGRSRFYRLGTHNSRVACVSTHLAWSLPRTYAQPFPFFRRCFYRPRVQRTYIRAYIIRSIRYLMAVSVSDVYPTLRSSPPWPGRQVFLSNLVFLAHRARCVQRERAHECTRFTVLGASDAKHIPLFSIFAPREIGSRSAIDLDERWRGEDMLFFVPNHRSFLMLIDVSSAGRGREVVPCFATKGPDKWREGRRCQVDRTRLLRANKKPLRLPFRCIRNIVA